MFKFEATLFLPLFYLNNKKYSTLDSYTMAIYGWVGKQDRKWNLHPRALLNKLFKNTVKGCRLLDIFWNCHLDIKIWYKNRLCKERVGVLFLSVMVLLSTAPLILSILGPVMLWEVQRAPGIFDGSVCGGSLLTLFTDTVHNRCHWLSGIGLTNNKIKAQELKQN